MSVENGFHQIMGCILILGLEQIGIFSAQNLLQLKGKQILKPSTVKLPYV